MRKYFKNLWWAILGYPTYRLLQKDWYGSDDHGGSGAIGLVSEAGGKINPCRHDERPYFDNGSISQSILDQR